MRVIACSIIFLSGAVIFGLATVAQSRRYTTAEDYLNAGGLGLLIMVGGGIMFLLDYLRSWKQEP